MTQIERILATVGYLVLIVAIGAGASMGIYWLSGQRYGGWAPVGLLTVLLIILGILIYLSIGQYD